MSESFEVQAQVRVDEGKGASRRLRRLEGKVPGVVYGGESAAISISLIRKDLEKMMEPPYSTLTLMAMLKPPFSKTCSVIPRKAFPCTSISYACKPIKRSR
jgi:ribosomal protein L25 (general stress protein Ctc)